MFAFVTWLWGEKYPVDDVYKLHAALRRNYSQPFRFVCVTDQLDGEPEVEERRNGAIEFHAIRNEDLYLTKLQGCFARLRAFDPAWQRDLRLSVFVNIDLDCVVTGPLDPLFPIDGTFMILQGANSANPCPYNGSMMLIRAGVHPQLWTEFSVAAAKETPFHEFPDDQGWIADKIKGADGWKAGQDGVYAFHKPGWPGGDALPRDARVVFFPGSRSPEKFRHLDWIKAHWR